MQVPRQSLTRQNQGFNEAKNRHQLEHICHHHDNSLLIMWLLNALALRAALSPALLASWISSPAQRHRALPPALAESSQIFSA